MQCDHNNNRNQCVNCVDNSLNNVINNSCSATHRKVCHTSNEKDDGSECCYCGYNSNNCKSLRDILAKLYLYTIYCVCGYVSMWVCVCVHIFCYNFVNIHSHPLTSELSV